MEYIKSGETLIALIVNKREFPAGMEFWGPDNSPLQLGSCVYPKGKKLQSHIHKERIRIPEHKTVECLYIIEGLMEATFYSRNKDIIDIRTLVEGDCLMLYEGGHGFRILENNTKFIEVKNGPYVSVEADKEKF